MVTKRNKIIEEFNKTLFNTSASNYFSPVIDRIFPTNAFTGMKAVVKSVQKERHDIVSIDLKPNNKFRYFKPGQYIEVKIKINGTLYNRIFSISSPYDKLKQEGIITLTIQQQKEGKVTSYIHQLLKPGDIIEISEAMGDFTLEDKQTENVLFIAGGSGITPFRSMLYQCKMMDMHVTLLYYCNNESEHIFRKELEQFDSEKIKTILIDSSRDGFISADHLQTYCKDYKERTIFICGPAPMINAATNILKNTGVADSQIIIERFRPAIIHNESLENIHGNVMVIGQHQRSIAVNSKSNILETLEKNGIFPVYGCRMGICKKCQCTKKSGIVYDKITQKFSQNTEEKITICMSVPLGDVEINL